MGEWLKSYDVAILDIFGRPNFYVDISDAFRLKNRSLSTANITALEPQGAEDGKKTESAVQQQLEVRSASGAHARWLLLE